MFIRYVAFLLGSLNHATFISCLPPPPPPPSLHFSDPPTLSHSLSPSLPLSSLTFRTVNPMNGQCWPSLGPPVPGPSLQLELMMVLPWPEGMQTADRDLSLPSLPDPAPRRVREQHSRSKPVLGLDLSMEALRYTYLCPGRALTSSSTVALKRGWWAVKKQGLLMP